MSGPWEDYKPTAKPKKNVEVEAGPWTEYSQANEIDPYVGLKKNAIEALPAAGSAIGGLLTSPTVAGSVMGSAIGRGAGSLVQKGIEHFSGQEEEPLDVAKDVGLQTLQGAGEGLLGAGIAKTVGATGKLAGNVYKKAASAATRLPEQTLEYYAKNSGKIADLAERIGKDPESYADLIRAGFDKKIGSFMNRQNKAISDSLVNAPAVKTQPVIDALQRVQSSVDADAFPEVAAQLKKEIDTLTALGQEIPASKMNAFKQRFQDLASYDSTQTFRAGGGQVNTGFKQAAREARKLVNDANPAISEANNNLARLHEVKNVLNKNLIKEGAPSGALTSAGVGRNPRALKNLQRLGDIVGEDFVTPTQDFGVASQMSKAGLLGDFNTGIGLAPAMLGTSIGGPAGFLTAIATSPMGTKYVLPAGYKYGPKALGLLQRGSKTLVPAGSYLLED